MRTSLLTTGGAKLSIDFDTPVEGPRTFTPSNSTFQIYIDTPATLGGSVSTTVTVGETLQELLEHLLGLLVYILQYHQAQHFLVVGTAKRML